MSATQSAFARWYNGPVGPKTTSFWGPFSNMLLVGAALWDTTHKPVEDINTRMTIVLFGYSGLFMRFAYMVKPRNWFLFSVHATNVAAQGMVLAKKFATPPPGAVKPLPALPAAPSAAATSSSATGAAVATAEVK